MALTVTSRGTGTHNTGATTLVPGGRTATLAVGSMGVLAIALDNAGSGGATLIAPASWTDAKGNVWTRRINVLYDPGAASAGIEMAWYTAPITVALLTTDLGTITWSPAASPVAKAWTWYEVIPSGGNTVVYSTGGDIAGATAANATVVSASVPVGDAVIAGYFSESVAAVTGDSDTTNGTWTAQQTATIGSTTSGVRIASQQKVQTTTPSTQSYDVTVASQDRIAGYIILHELVATTVTPGAASLTLATFAPTVSIPDNQLVTPSAASLATATFAPAVAVTEHQTVTPTTATLTATRFAPTVTASDHQVVTPASASLATAQFAPVVSVSDHQTVTPDAASLALASFVPTVSTSAGQTVVPSPASLALTTFAPAVGATDHRTVTPGAATLSITPLTPTVIVSDHQVVIPAPADLDLAAFPPTVTATDHQTVTPPPAALSITPFAPIVSAGVYVNPAVAALVLASFAPDVALTDDQLVTPEAAQLALTTFAASVLTPRVVTPGGASLLLTSFAPAVGQGVAPQRGSVTVAVGLLGEVRAAIAVAPQSAAVERIGDVEIGHE